MTKYNTKVTVSKDKSPYESWEIIEELARTKQEIITEKLRSNMIHDVQGVMNFSQKMLDELDNLIVQAKQIIATQGPDTKMHLGVNQKGAPITRQASTVLTAATEAKKTGSLNSAQGWKDFSNTYLRNFKAGQELGHEDLAVSTAKVAIMLDQMEQDDPLRPALRAYYMALKKVDAITEKNFGDSGTIEEILTSVTGIATKTNIKSSIKTDVNAAKGMASKVIQYSYEPGKINKAKGVLSRKLLAEVTKLFEGKDASGVYTDVIRKNNINVSKLEGSLSLVKEVREAIINTALGKPQRKIKNTITKKRRRKKDPMKEARKKIKMQIRRFKQASISLKKVNTRPTAASGSNESFASLYALINAKLPRTVAENMGAPGLESRSGRFAGSVRVTDVNRTAKGFPSVGYTYQKNPYQVFEMGVGHSSWATTARDPRTVIDASIREIAQELAVGRLYTRRV